MDPVGAVRRFVVAALRHGAAHAARCAAQLSSRQTVLRAFASRSTGRSASAKSQFTAAAQQQTSCGARLIAADAAVNTSSAKNGLNLSPTGSRSLVGSSPAHADQTLPCTGLALTHRPTAS